MTRLLPGAALLVLLLVCTSARAQENAETTTATLTLEEPLPSFPNGNDIDFRPTAQGPVLVGFPNNNDIDIRPEPVTVDTTGGKKRLRFTVPWPEGAVEVEVVKTKDGTYVGNCTQGEVTVPCMMAFPNTNDVDI